MSEDDVRAEQRAWKAYAEACCEHNTSYGRHACDELARLLPHPRPVVVASSPTKG